MIVVNGDSFVHEYHLDPEKRWSTIIKADANLAIGAGSNDRTFTTTIEYIHNHDVRTLIIGWTDWNRSYFNKSNGSRYKLIGGDAIDELLGDNHNDPDVAKFYLTKVFNEFTQLKNTLVQMLHTQELCKLKKIKLINFATVFDAGDLNNENIIRIAKNAFMSRRNKDEEAMGIKYNMNLLHTYINKLDSSCWINNNVFSSMKTILQNYPKHSETDRHIGVEGSNKWAEILSKHLH
jgi:hypothetical protein